MTTEAQTVALRIVFLLLLTGRIMDNVGLVRNFVNAGEWTN